MLKKNKQKIIILSLTFLSFANLTFATTFAELVEKLTTGILAKLVYLALSAAVLFFLWGVFMFVMNATDEGKRSEGKQRMVWGIIAIFVMVSAWGIISIAKNSFDLDSKELKIQMK